jgi:hypothetical protein
MIRFQRRVSKVLAALPIRSVAFLGPLADYVAAHESVDDVVDGARSRQRGALG